MGTSAHYVKTGLKLLLYYGADSLAYRLRALGPVDPRRALFVEMGDSCSSMDFELVMRELRRRGYEYELVCLHRRGGIGPRYALACVRMSWKAARVRLLFVRDASMPVGCLPMRSQTSVVQLWHACGAFKRFGHSSATMLFGPGADEMRRFPHYGNTTLATVSSPEVVWAYEEAMGLKGTGAVQALGVSRTDAFFNKDQTDAWLERAQSVVPQTKDRRVLLYAPTFRGKITDPEAPDFLDLELLAKALGDGWVVLVKHHPLVRERPAIPVACSGLVFDVSESLSIEEAMMASDVCVTDYSSLVFEWSLLDRPVAFLAPDRDDYDDWRGFYYDYDQMTPGPVFVTTEELADWVCELPRSFNKDALAEFRQKFMSSCDGHATERILDAALAENGAKGDSPLLHHAALEGGEKSHVG